MNSLQLAQRLARNLTVEDPFNLPADAALDVLAAMNAGLATFYREMPAIYRRSLLSHTVKGPRALTVTFAAQYSRLVADNTFTLGEIGATVRFGNGSADNVVTGLNNVLDDYLGTVLQLPATVYGDAVPIQDVIEHVVGHVRLYDNTQTSPTFLTRDERLRSGRCGWSYGGGSDPEQFYPSNSLGADLRTVGRPMFYYLEAMGASQGAEPEFIMRLAPLPDKDYTVRLEAELSAQRLLFADLATARTINVGDSYLDDIVIPICEAELTGSFFWRDKEKITAVLAKAEKAIGKKITKIPADLGAPQNFSGTPRGY